MVKGGLVKITLFGDSRNKKHIKLKDILQRKGYKISFTETGCSVPVVKYGGIYYSGERDIYLCFF